MLISTDPIHIIAIGASAGGLDEINLFFDHTPPDGVSYIIIQHLSPDFKSRMIELLARHSKLKVVEAENEMLVVSNEVYLIPNDKFMTINDGKLYLTDKEKNSGAKFTINKFFNSLAVDCGNKAIGIILSGLGNDGTEGIKAIKKAGGMTMACDPEKTQFRSMPESAIDTGHIDFILLPAEMPKIIEEYVKNEGKLLADDINDGKNILAIIELIKEKSLLDFSDYKIATILRRTKRRASYNNFFTLEAYLKFLKNTPGEIEILSKEFLISVTSFFRDKEAFDFIQKNIIPQILEKLKPGEEMKIWVAGCATGEEAYSIAILIHEQLKDNYQDIIVKIFATDIDVAALAHARKGVYSQTILKGMSQERIDSNFIKEGKNYKIIPEIRGMVIFAQHDLVKNPPYCNMHLISCRNLLIYMTPVLQKKIFSMMLFGLKMDGFLFLGSSENPMPILKNLEVISKKWKIYKNQETKRGVGLDAFSLPELFNVKSTPSYKTNDSQNSGTGFIEVINENLVAEMDCLIICVNENNEVLKSYGDTTKYLFQKNFNSKLNELLPQSLLVAYNTLSNNVIRTNKKAKVSGIKIRHEGIIMTVSLSVSPIVIKKGEQKLLMLTFTEDKPSFKESKNDLIFDEKIYLNQYTKNLEEELREAKDKLQSTYELLDASNENMQSFSEELISANEEMQSTNEEMQSVNEELDTINSNYQLKNKELLEINDDLNNYFRSNINGQLFINDDMLLVKFSPGTVKLINLLETDIGRPISNISTNIKFETIIEDVKLVLEKGIVITKEIETNDDKWYQIMTMPYFHQSYSRNSGAIITFNDITELKKTEIELDKKNKSLMRINADLDNFVYAASHDLLAPLNNIEGSIDVMMNQIKTADPELKKFLNIINSSIIKFRSLIKEIAAIAKLESNMTETELINLDEMISNIEWSLEDKIISTSAIITRDLEVTHLFFSKKNLRSILYNLISNSIKFKRDKKPVINIHTAKKGDLIILEVKDNGIGIAKADIDKIFNKYGRLNHDTDGQGIGLYLAKKL